MMTDTPQRRGLSPAADPVPWDDTLVFISGDDLDAVIRAAPLPTPEDAALLAAWFPLAPLPLAMEPAA